MTRLAAFLAAVATVACPSAPAQEGPAAPVLYYPTTVGARWTYRYPGGEAVSIVVTAVQKKGDAWVVSVGRIDALGAVTPQQTVEVSAKGVHRLESVVYTYGPDGLGGTARTEEVVADVPPVCLLKLPAKAGERWEAVYGRLGPASFTTGREEAVKVPAGAFTAVPVDCALKGAAGTPAARGRTWHAPGVGPVKWVGADGSESVLTAFSPGKKEPARPGGPR